MNTPSLLATWVNNKIGELRVLAGAAIFAAVIRFETQLESNMCLFKL